MIYLTEEDQQTLKQMFRWYRSQVPKTEGAFTERQPPSRSPVTYIAKIGTGDTLAALDTGTDTPGELECEIYQPGGLTGNAVPQAMGFTANVLNYTAGSFSEGTYITVVKEQYGYFIVCGAAGASADVCEANKALTEATDYDDAADWLVGIDASEDPDACKKFTSPVCTTLRGLSDGTYDKDTIKIVGVNTADTPDSCELYGDVVCPTVQEYTVESHDEDVRLIGHDTVSNTCHRYDVFGDLDELKTQICKVAAILDVVVTELGIGGDNLCP